MLSKCRVTKFGLQMDHEVVLLHQKTHSTKFFTKPLLMYFNYIMRNHQELITTELLDLIEMCMHNTGAQISTILQYALIHIEKLLRLSTAKCDPPTFLHVLENNDLSE